MPELLIELFCEEIPARMQRGAASDFSRLLAEALAPLGTPSFATSHGLRRIAAVGEVAAATEASATQERGPRANAPPAALAGFLKKHGATQEQLRQEGDYWVLEKSAPAIVAEALIARELPGVIRKLPWPKSMRWGGSGDFTFGRPLRRVLCVFDGHVVPVDGLPAGLATGDVTEGHRFLHPVIIKVASDAEYVARLRDACVIVDVEERKRLVAEGAAKVAAEAGLRVVEDAGLLEEVSGLVEWPVPMLGRIDAQFMDLPPEVLRTSMRVNQRYFATTYPDGKPAPHFVVIANVPGSDGGAAIVAGNERVLRARFSDARFFWDQDRKQPLEAFLPKLETVTFHAKLGTQAQRVERITELSKAISRFVSADMTLAEQAAQLCKADLATGMVGEFPELQGVMGGYYASLGLKPPEVAAAIRDHYAPRGPYDALPTLPVSIAVSLADKVDQLAAFFAAAEFPTGSGDPFGLRRAALGIIRIVLAGRIRIDLRHIFTIAAGLAVVSIRAAEEARAELERRAPSEPVVLNDARQAKSGQFQFLEPEGCTNTLLNFMGERLRVQRRAAEKRSDTLDAVMGQPFGGDILRAFSEADALDDLLHSADGTAVLTSYKRAVNILRIEERKDARTYTGPADPALLRDRAEQTLHAALAHATPAIDQALRNQAFPKAMAAMASLRQPLDTFFADVTVNAPETELRENRLKLLASLREKFDRIADFSKIEG